MREVKAKKHLGQHFLRDESVTIRIAEAVSDAADVLEIGPGTGVLTKYLLDRRFDNFKVAEIDRESIAYLQAHYPMLRGHIIEEDILKLDTGLHFKGKHTWVGNLPYYISSQIMFKLLDDKHKVTEGVFMVQKEVGTRIASPPGNRDYGILSVLLQAYYDIEYLFTVEPIAFEPPPKVRSGVIRLRRNEREKLDCDEKLFKQLVKQGFNTRRKTLRNALKVLNLPEAITQLPLLDRRAETLSYADFADLARQVEEARK